ncbi:hypothetical protein GIB67_014468 [Kingdonia uniflora]|uniref:Protein EI24 homolog n=1 Tax=Kingdonia uniflora TaxID=39325 RepID=A0A7J7LZD5_9MAGN|nr:hypothetical protein GIB67_014468 [Kingdonia uniflora]
MAITDFMVIVRAKAKQALFLWFEGFIEACCLHRVVIFCFRSKKLSIRTGQCFLLNGFIFLGSIFILNSVVIPTLQWILPHQCQQFGSSDPCSFGGIAKLYSFLHHGLIQLFYIFWFYPLYVFSFVLSNIWYNDIAKYGYAAMGGNDSVIEPSRQKDSSQNPVQLDKPAGLGGVMIGIGEQVYSVLLLSFFFLEVFAAGFVPYVGKTLNFLLLSWMYAYYCFEYKWNLVELGLDKRLDFFESNWAFFFGFGSPCVLAIFFCSPLVSYGVMAILFPLYYDKYDFQFVLTATGSKVEQVISSQRRTRRGAGLGRLPIFYAADTLSMRVLSLFAETPHGRKKEKKDI